LDYATHNKAITALIKTDIPCWILGKVEEFYSCCLLDDKHPEGLQVFVLFFIYTARSNTKIITPSRYLRTP
jgi:hypothetical protein